ncbi:MAG: DUF1501 domain-containing protein [Planctomycetes bacterium]|nr:DUF1501 domain-containing protein [Planctomycetota bacterium]
MTQELAIAMDGTPDDARALVVVFLRGGADGLALVPPTGDDGYHRARPRLALEAKETLALDARFAFPRELAELHPWFLEGRLAVVHACGSDDETRSHFEAQDLMEHGGATIAGGWIGRFLRSTASRASTSPRGALAIGALVPESLRGAPSATALRSIDEVRLGDDAGGLRGALGELYAGDELLGASARDALSAAARIGELVRADPRPEHGAEYPDARAGNVAESFGRELALVARLVKARVGMRAATIDLDGWDSHFVQGTVVQPRMRALSLGLAAFARDLGPGLDTTSVVVMTEFGRRVGENGSLGTDHGRGGALFVLGGGTRGGLHCRWPGLEEASLVGPGDLAVVHDYRDALASVLARHGGARALGTIFPDRELAPLPL